MPAHLRRNPPRCEVLGPVRQILDPEDIAVMWFLRQAYWILHPTAVKGL